MEQLGLRLKKSGIDLVEENNESWVVEMRAFAKTKSILDQMSGGSGGVTADDCRGHANRVGWWPEHPNAYGSLFRGKDWQCVGRKKSEWPGNHAREIKIWRYISQDTKAFEESLPW